MKQHIINWIRDYFVTNAYPECKAVIGISGGKDSSVVAALCVEALGPDRVVGVLMPQGEQSDIDYAYKLVEHLGINSMIVNIGETVECLEQTLQNSGLTLSNQTTVNLPARIRMTTLYGVAQSVGGRVANTCNASEDYVGYSTKYGDAAGDFAPLANYTVKDVLKLGKELGLPDELIHKTPSDGLSGKTDEDNLGFTYAELDDYIMYGIKGEHYDDIKRKHEKNLHKLKTIPKCPNYYVRAIDE